MLIKLLIKSLFESIEIRGMLNTVSNVKRFNFPAALHIGSRRHAKIVKVIELR